MIFVNHSKLYYICPENKLMTKHKRKGAGGKRPGAGRKSVFKEKTDTIKKTVPKSKKEYLSEKWDNDLNQYK